MTTAELPGREIVISPRIQKWRRRWTAANMAAAAVVAKAKTHKVVIRASLPGAAGSLCLAVSAGMRFGGWAGVGVAGLLLLRVDSRM